MAPLFAFNETDVWGWGCFTFIIALPLGLLLALLLGLCLYRLIRWCNMRPIGKCPRCRARPTVLEVLNVCWKCGCEYDKWGFIHKSAPPVQLNDLDLARFKAQSNPVDSSEGSQEFKPGSGIEP